MLQKICLSLLITLLLAGCMNSNGDGDSHKPKQEQPTNAESSNDQESEDQTATEEHEDQTATNPSSDPNKKENYPWWRHSVQEHEKNLTFVDHHTKGSNGKYTIDLTITCPPEYRFYYDLIVVDSNGKHEVIKKREVSLPPEASYRPEHITFSISLPSRPPKEGLAYAVLYKLDENGKQYDAIQVKLEIWE